VSICKPFTPNRFAKRSVGTCQAGQHSGHTCHSSCNPLCCAPRVFSAWLVKSRGKTPTNLSKSALSMFTYTNQSIKLYTIVYIYIYCWI
jgi:hypothetical protein